MKKLSSILLLLATLVNLAFAQTKTGLLKGKVSDKSNQPIAGASILLYGAKDSVLAKTAISDKAGLFEMAAIPEGEYRLKISSMGFAETEQQGITVEAGKTTAIQDIQLAPATKELGNVTVTAKKPVIEVKADKTVFNVENSISAQGSNALELLQKTPGVQVDNNENISMKGKTGVKVYIDGRMTQLETKDLAAYLRSINSNDIESIEIISNPSAKYDASGNAGILNIKLKKNKKYGTNGSVNLGYVQGITPKGNGSVNLNYRDKKVNIFGNVGGNIGNYENGIDLYRIQNDTIYDQKGTNINATQSVNAKIGTDFFANKNNTFGVLGTINISDNDWRAESRTPIYDEKTGQLAKTLVARNNIPHSRTNANINANYRYSDTSGRELNVDLDYGLFRGTGRSKQPNLYLLPDGTPDYLVTYGNYTPTDIDIYTAKADVEQKAWGGKLGYGAKISFVETDNTFDFYNYDNGAPVFNASRSNTFRYLENVNAAYVNYNRPLSSKWTLQAGLRAEQTNSDGKLTRADGKTQDDDHVVRHYLDLFPSAALTWAVDKSNALNLTYSRRIDRPTYQDLNPFENKLDELTFEKGNAFLQPQYTNNVELTHTLKGMINTTIGYSYVKDYSTQVTDTTDGNATYIQQRNLANQQILSANIGSPIPIAKWWNGYVNIWYNYMLFKGTFNNGTINEKVPTYGAYMQHTINVGKKGTKAELSGWFNGPGIWGGTWRTKPMGGLDAGVQQPLFKNKASVKLSVTDMLYTSPWRSETNFGGVYIKGRGYWESRTFRVNFTWRFGSKDVKDSRQRKTGLETEAGRIKGK